MPKNKEVHFFDKNFDKGTKWYEKQFNEYNGERVIGEFTPNYIYSKQAPKLITNILNNPKLIVCFRNPVDRAYSRYSLDIRMGTHNLSFKEALKKYPEYIERGFYYKQIKRYLKYFDRSLILILIYEDIVDNPVSFIQKIYDFLEVEKNFVPAQVNIRRNRGLVYRKSILLKLYSQISNFIVKNRFLNSLANSVKNVNCINNSMEKFIFSKGKPNIKSELRHQLNQKFREQTQKLSKLLNRDLTEEWSY